MSKNGENSQDIPISGIIGNDRWSKNPILDPIFIQICKNYFYSNIGRIGRVSILKLYNTTWFT